MTAIEVTHEPLLRHAELGRATRRGHDLPPDSFVYGISTTGDRLGAAKALGSWYGTENDFTLGSRGQQMDAMGGSLKRSNTFNGRDFVAMNKAATKKGLHTSSDFAKYKFTHNVEKQPMTMDTNTNKAEVGRIPPETVFGQANRAGTPVMELMGNRYQQKWLQEKRQNESVARARSRQSKDWPCSSYEARPPISVGPHVSTFRSAKARMSALENHEYESASRFGYLGQGAHATPPY
ncbi:cilia- and flagella-associated protein 77-like [Symsagittifera roscoffensis]|uniref:cilia- and flagella-associated protein 77-like n=1 Tax=Symsagittifera roscoffensis TaxID=84072 RepID=UPI00307BB8BB